MIQCNLRMGKGQGHGGVVDFFFPGDYRLLVSVLKVFSGSRRNGAHYAERLFRKCILAWVRGGEIAEVTNHGSTQGVQIHVSSEMSLINNDRFCFLPAVCFSHTQKPSICNTE